MKSPLTASENVSLLRTVKTRPLIAEWQETYQIDISEDLDGLDEFEVYQCDDTGVLFFQPEHIAGSDTLYRQLQTIPWYYQTDKWEHRTALKSLSSGMSVMEVGCGAGAFVRAAQRAGLEARGIEINAAAVDIARQQGLPVDLLDLQDAAESLAGQFDAVCSFQVLEHVPQPGDFLRLSLALLKPGGVLIACVPNGDSFLKYQHDLLDMPPHHMSRWTPEAFRALEKHFPVRLVRCLKEPMAPYFVSKYVKGYGSHVRAHRPYGKIIFNRVSSLLYQGALNMGLRRLLAGHCLYAEFAKTGD